MAAWPELLVSGPVPHFLTVCCCSWHKPPPRGRVGSPAAPARWASWRGAPVNLWRAAGLSLLSAIQIPAGGSCLLAASARLPFQAGKNWRHWALEEGQPGAGVFLGPLPTGGLCSLVYTSESTAVCWPAVNPPGPAAAFRPAPSSQCKEGDWVIFLTRAVSPANYGFNQFYEGSQGPLSGVIMLF